MHRPFFRCCSNFSGKILILMCIWKARVLEWFRLQWISRCTNIHLKKTGMKNVPLPTEFPGTAERFFYHWGRQLKSQQNEGICGSAERSEVLLDVRSVMLTLRLATEAVNKSGCKAGFEVSIGLCSPIPTITKVYGSVLASILGPPSFVIVI